MGIFNDYDIDIDSVKENNFDVEDGVYHFEVAEAEVLDGTQNKPDDTFFIIDYQLEDENGDAAGQKRAWYTLAQDGEITKRAQQSLSFLKSDLMKLGLKGAQLADFDGSEIVGKRGTLQLKTTPGKNGKGEFQNIRNIRLDESDEEEAPAKPARRKAAPKAEAEAPARTTRRKAAPKAVEPDEDDNDNPFGDD